MSIKKIMALALVVLLAASVAGPQKAVAEDVELTFWVLTFSGTTNDTIASITEEFEKANPGIKVNIEKRGTDEHQEQLRIIMGTDAAPDLYFMWTGVGIGGWYVQRGASLPLNDAYETLGWKDRFVSSAVAASTYGDEMHGIPFRLNGVNVYYRKDLFEKAGIEKEPSTYEELIDVNEKLLAAGITPFAMGGQTAWHIMRVMDVINEYTCGAEIHDGLLMMEKSWADEPCATEAWTEFSQWIKKGYVHKDNLGVDHTGAFMQHLAGDGAMMIEGPWQVNKLAINEQDLDNFGMFPFPTGTNRIYFFSENFYVSASTKHPDEAIKFLDFFSSPEVQQRYIGTMGSISVVKGLTYPEDQRALDAEWVDYFAKTPEVFLIGDQGFPLEVKFEYQRLINEVNAGTTDPAEAGKIFQAFIDNYLANQ